ncbi:MAG: hypothetical protein EZS28_020095 [Streblomastix strix]|uniref:Uncharacterized protein n=1 Tax=Streblomastix strix TaxID=222440 RepID=A0A5J4VP15_9EUKA|nr:MAG: hypothetical protein EZS28_020095 [Streblomastix strix]
MNFDQEVQPDIAQTDEEITRKILLIAQKIPNCSVQEQTALLIKLVDIVSYERAENPNRSTRTISKPHKIKSNLLKAKTIYRASLKISKKERFKSISGRLQNNLLQALMT